MQHDDKELVSLQQLGQYYFEKCLPIDLGHSIQIQ